MWRPRLESGTKETTHGTGRADRKSHATLQTPAPEIHSSPEPNARVEGEPRSHDSQAAESIGTAYEAARETEQKFETALKEQEQRALELNKIAIPFNVLVREVESDLYTLQLNHHAVERN